MPENSYRTIEKLLTGTDLEELRQGLDLVKRKLSGVNPQEAKPLFEMVSTIFYIDLLDRPDLVSIVDEAISLVAGFGKWVIPALVERLVAGDLKAQMAAAHALGRIGAEAIEPLVAEYQASDDPARRSFILYALGKVKSPKVVHAAHLALDAAQSSDRELRDTAMRAVGKFAESIPPQDLSEQLRRGFIEELKNGFADPNPGIRAKAIRSLGKLAQHGHLSDEEREKLRATCLLIAGRDQNFEWDHAYIVRKEAEEALKYL